MMVGIAMLIMIVVTTAVHLGLPDAIAKAISKVMQCHKCLTFWLTLIVLTLLGTNIFIAALLSIFAAYVSNWFSLLLNALFKLYNRLWERLNK